jgi:hypothetical protein
MNRTYRYAVALGDEIQNAVLVVLLGLEVLAIPFHQGSLESGLAAIAAVYQTISVQSGG